MKYILPLSLGIIGTFLVVLFGWLLISSAAYEEPICNPYFTYYNECRNQICRGGYGGTGPTLSIFYYNPLTNDYEIPEEYHVGERYSLNGSMMNDNYCKKQVDADEKYNQYKLNPQNFTNSPEYLDLKFTYLVQISKLSDTEKPSVVYLNSFDGVIKAREEKMHSFQWVPKEDGQYLIERFIWHSIDKSIVLTPKHAIYVEVYDHPYSKKIINSTQKPKENDSPYYDLLPPLKQLKTGIKKSDIRCSEELTLIMSSNGKPSCVWPSTAITLKLRGWSDIFDPIKLETLEYKNANWFSPI